MRFQHHKTGTIACLAILLMVLLRFEARAADKVIFDRPASAADHRREYANALLRQVMERTVPEFGPYTISYAHTHMERPRLFEVLKEGRLVNVTAYPADARWLKELLSVPVPIDMGLQSWRIALIDKRQQARMRRLRLPGELKQLKAGVGIAWVTTASLRDNGFAVVTGGSYDGLFEMLMAGRFDYMPRGAHEAWSEEKVQQGLIVEPTLFLHYRAPFYFFVNRDNTELAERIERGLKMALADGSFERLLNRYPDFRRGLAEIAARKRTVLELELPNRRGPIAGGS